MKKSTGFEITISGEIMKFKFSYPPTFEDWISGLKLTSKKYPFRLRMWIFNKGIALSPDELKAGAHQAKNLFPADSKLALVSESDVGYGISRIYNAYREDTTTQVMVFRSEEKAEKWLLGSME